MGITELTLGTRTLPATKGGLELYWTSKRTWATARPSLVGPGGLVLVEPLGCIIRNLSKVLWGGVSKLMEMI